MKTKITPHKGGRTKKIEYRIYRGSRIEVADVDHIQLKEVNLICKNPDADILLIEKVQRIWESDGTLTDEKILNTLYEKGV